MCDTVAIRISNAMIGRHMNVVKTAPMYRYIAYRVSIRLIIIFHAWKFPKTHLANPGPPNNMFMGLNEV